MASNPVGSLWPGVWLHASHNVFFQEIYPNLTTERDSTSWYVDEFGAFSAVAAVLVALFFWSRRGALTGRLSPGVGGGAPAGPDTPIAPVTQ